MMAVDPALLGHAAALATSCLFTATTLFFTAAGRRIGSMAVNATRIYLAVILLGVTHLALAGTWIPQATAAQVGFLAISGVIGLTIGDGALFAAFLMIGPRLALLLMTTSPVFAAGFGWLVLGEVLPPAAWLGVILTVGGVAWVLRERQSGQTQTAAPRRLRGVILALLAAACQAGGLLLSKVGMGEGIVEADQKLDPQAATLIRMFFAGIAVTPLLCLDWQRRRRTRFAGGGSDLTGSKLAGFGLAACGSCVGPYLGVWMSLEAAQRAPLGEAQALMSLSPVLILPLARLVHQERITRRAVAGAVVALAGAAILSLTRAA